MTEAIPIQPGTTMRIADIIKLIEGSGNREHWIGQRSFNSGAYEIPATLNTTSKAFHQNQCWNAMHNCERCKADCSDREGQP